MDIAGHVQWGVMLHLDMGGEAADIAKFSLHPLANQSAASPESSMSALE